MEVWERIVLLYSRALRTGVREIIGGFVSTEGLAKVSTSLVLFDKTLRFLFLRTFGQKVTTLV